MLIAARNADWGYSAITSMEGPYAPSLMDFGILRLRPGETYHSLPGKERAFLLLHGACETTFDGIPSVMERSSVFDEPPWCLSLPADASADILALNSGAELAVQATTNPRRFGPRLYTPADCRSEDRGKGTMRETSTRIVRTILEDPGAAHTNHVLGEVITYPGKWSSYPPHHHQQPEIYHYRFLPEGGFGVAVVGETAHVVRHGDTLLIPPEASHPQASAPGYAMYYLWVIRHLDGNRYSTPAFQPEHLWVTDPAATIWP